MNETLGWLVLAAIGGTGLGVVTGLLPGLHVNTLAPVLVGLGLSLDAPLVAAVVIVATATTHTVLNVVPTLAAPLPDEDTALMLLPIQQMARAGRACEALRISVRASWVGGLSAIVVVLAAAWTFPRLPSMPPAWTTLGVTAIVALLILKHPRGPLALFVFLLSGAIGALMLSMRTVGPFGGDGNMLLPIFTGFFGFPMLWLALREAPVGDASSPVTDSSDPGSRLGVPALATIVGTFCGILVSLFPGLTSATAGAFGRALRRPDDDVEEVAMLSAVDTANAVGNAGALLLWGATRSGASIAMERVAGPLLATDATRGLAVVLGALVVSLVVGSSVALAGGPWLVTKLRGIPPRIAASAGIALLAMIVLLVNGFWGLLVAVMLVPLGLLPHRWQVPRALLMGVLLVPFLVSVHSG